MEGETPDRKRVKSANGRQGLPTGGPQITGPGSKSQD